MGLVCEFSEALSTLSVEIIFFFIDVLEFHLNVEIQRSLW